MQHVEVLNGPPSSEPSQPARRQPAVPIPATCLFKNFISSPTSMLYGQASAEGAVLKLYG
jgi:hypothetical protein